MNKNDEKYYLEKCKLKIEKVLGIGESSKWKQRDFEYLCEQVYNKTKINISLSTIKRIWNAEFKSIPQPATLNALAAYLDCADWNSFKKSIALQDEVVSIKNTEFEKKRINYKPIFFFILSALIIAGICIAGYTFLHAGKFNKNLDKVKFTLTKTSIGFPNTVVFYYDVSCIKPEKVTIQQTWDPKMTVEANPNGHYRTCIYYYPRYYTAKLFADGKLIKEEKFILNVTNWTPLVIYQFWDSIPVYVRNTDFSKKEVVYLSPNELAKNGVQTDKDYYTLYYLVRDFQGLPSNNFIFETKLKNNIEEGAKVCQTGYVAILCENGWIVVPFTNKGCVSTIKVLCSEKSYLGKDNDLSVFGCNMNQWQNIKITSLNHLIQVYLNGTLIYKLTYNQEMGNVIGILYMFNGCGAFKDVSLKRSNKEEVYKYPL